MGDGDRSLPEENILEILNRVIGIAKCRNIGIMSPAYWKYCRHSACHWIVNFALKLAMLSEPSRKWRIISSQSHSTVWDGRQTLFDFNFQAMGIDAEECYEIAMEENKELLPGKMLRVYYAESIASEIKKDADKKLMVR